MSFSYPRTNPLIVLDASDEMWKGKFEFGPFNTGAVETNFLSSAKETSHLSFHLISTFPIKMYSGAIIFEMFSINLQ